MKMEHITVESRLRNVLVCLDFAGSNGRRESQGSLSSGASLELGTSGSGRNEVLTSHTKQIYLSPHLLKHNSNKQHLSLSPFLTVSPCVPLCLLFSSVRVMFHVAQYRCQPSAEEAAPPWGSVTLACRTARVAPSLWGPECPSGTCCWDCVRSSASIWQQ